MGLSITKATLTITAADKSKITHGDANPPLTGTIAGIRNGDGITATYVAGTAGSLTWLFAIGSYGIVPTAVDASPAKLANYTVIPW